MYTYLKLRLQKICGAGINLNQQRQNKYGDAFGPNSDGSVLPSLASTGPKYFKSDTCGEALALKNADDSSRFPDSSPWVDRTSRIYHGRDSVLGRWPWFLSIVKCKCSSHSTSTADQMHLCPSMPIEKVFCGGSLISKNYGISALHCFRHKNDPKTWYGSSSGKLSLDNYFTDQMTDLQYCVLTKTESLKIGVTTNYQKDLRRISKIYWPKSWLNNQYDYGKKRRIEGFDVVLMRWEVEYEFNDYRQPVCIPDFKTIPDDYQTCWLVGYGKTGKPMTGESKLQEMALKYYPLADCAKHYTFQFKLSESLNIFID